MKAKQSQIEDVEQGRAIKLKEQQLKLQADEFRFFINRYLRQTTKELVVVLINGKSTCCSV